MGPSIDLSHSSFCIVLSSLVFFVCYSEPKQGWHFSLCQKSHTINYENFTVELLFELTHFHASFRVLQ